MKKCLLGVVIITLTLSACRSSKTATGEEAVATRETPAPTEAAEATDTPATAVEDTPIDVAVQATSPPAATSTPYPTHTALPTYTPYATYTPYPTATPLSPASSTAAPLPTSAPTSAQAATPMETPTEEPIEPPGQAPPVQSGPAPAATTVELRRIADPDPGPPFTVLVSTIQVIKDGNYKVTGMVYNDGSEIYSGVGIIGTFFDKDGHRYGPIKVQAACTLLEPGAGCPFSLEIYPRDYEKYHLHPDGAPVEYRQPAPLALRGLNVSNDGLGNVRFTGTTVNGNPFTVKDAHISGTLMNAKGQIVSVGSTLVLGDIDPGASVPFELRIKYLPYSRYELQAQATQK